MAHARHAAQPQGVDGYGSRSRQVQLAASLDVQRGLFVERRRSCGGLQRRVRRHGHVRAVWQAACQSQRACIDVDGTDQRRTRTCDDQDPLAELVQRSVAAQRIGGVQRHRLARVNLERAVARQLERGAEGESRGQRSEETARKDDWLRTVDGVETHRAAV